MCFCSIYLLFLVQYFTSSWFFTTKSLAIHFQTAACVKLLLTCSKQLLLIEGCLCNLILTFWYKTVNFNGIKLVNKTLIYVLKGWESLRPWLINTLYILELIMESKRKKALSVLKGSFLRYLAWGHSFYHFFKGGFLKKSSKNPDLEECKNKRQY